MIRELKPRKGMHWKKNVENGDIYEGTIYLGIYDSPSNYIEVTEEEYQQYLIDKENETELQDYEH